MTSYTDKLKKLNANYQRTKAAEVGGGFDLPKGTYQFVVTKATFGQSTAPFALNELEVKCLLRVLTGDNKGKMGSMAFFLEQPAKDNFQSGMSLFKALIEGLGISLPGLSEKALIRACKELIGQKLRGYCTGKNGVVYFNGPIDVEDDDFDEEEFDDADDELEEDTEEEAEEEAPRKKKSTRKKATRRRASDDDDEFDLEDFSD